MFNDSKRSPEEMNELLKRYNGIQLEILKIGWQGVMKKYHPDINCEDPDCKIYFDLYKAVYDLMKERLMIKTDDLEGV